MRDYSRGYGGHEYRESKFVEHLLCVGSIYIKYTHNVILTVLQGFIPISQIRFLRH